jgi:small-conductance mechanosensitive channel
VEHYQGQLLKCKDARMGIVNEVLNSMRVIKYYAWERKFTHKINAARRAEVGKLRQYAVTNAMLYTFWEIVPAIVGATAFVLHTYVLGKSLGLFV